MTKVCAWCGCEFDTPYPDKKYHGDTCKNKAKYDRRSTNAARVEYHRDYMLTYYQANKDRWLERERKKYRAAMLTTEGVIREREKGRNRDATRHRDPTRKTRGVLSARFITVIAAVGHIKETV